jgi:cell division protein FtsI/penicillin-binding protein 2
MKLELQHGSRTRTLALLVMILMAVFVVRLFYLQVIQHDEYVARAAEEQVKRLTIPATRGLIYAMDGTKPVQLVMNETVYTVFADPQVVKDKAQVIESVRNIAGGTIRPQAASLLEKKNSRYEVLATKLSRKQAELLKEKKLAGIGFQGVTQRVYPEGGLAAQTLGFVNGEGTGQYGIEGKLNDRLKGQDGVLQSVTDVSNVPLTIGNNNINKPAKNGDNIVLSLDRNIQSYAEQALAAGLARTKAQKGSVLVMDPQSGKIMAMANLPTYKPEAFNTVTDASAFNNAIISAPYEAGSVIKTLTVATGIDKGVIKPDSTYVNNDVITVGGKKIGNATKGQTGTITLQRALNYSLNTGMVTIAQRLGDGQNINLSARSTMYSYFHDKFRLGQPTGVELSGEAAGNIVQPDDASGAEVRYSNMSFGQGMDVTMVQVASAFSSIINGGTYYKPTVVNGTMNDATFTEQQPEVVQSGVISKATSDAAREMVHTARSTFYKGSDKPGFEVGGKTGTSQTIVNGDYSDDQTIGTYLGYGGNDTPRYVIMVQVSGKNMNLEGGKHAMPIFTDISNWMIDYMKLQPKG